MRQCVEGQLGHRLRSHARGGQWQHAALQVLNFIRRQHIFLGAVGTEPTFQKGKQTSDFGDSN